MSSNRELLELAAKAAGLVDYEYTCTDQGGYEYMAFDEGGSKSEYWNPLEDSEDALLLASKLGLTIDCGNKCIIAPIEMIGEGTDPLVATRRAIVHVAAEIGKAMP